MSAVASRSAPAVTAMIATVSAVLARPLGSTGVAVQATQAAPSSSAARRLPTAEATPARGAADRGALALASWVTACSGGSSLEVAADDRVCEISLIGGSPGGGGYRARAAGRALPPRPRGRRGRPARGV